MIVYVALCSRVKIQNILIVHPIIFYNYQLLNDNRYIFYIHESIDKAY